MQKRFASILVLALVASTDSLAVELIDEEIKELGSHTGQTIFMYLKSSALRDHGCRYEVLYCPNTNPDCRSMLSIALAAKTTSAKIYVSFQKGSDDRCLMDHIKF
jgi:hypothetical protein